MHSISQKLRKSGSIKIWVKILKIAITLLVKLAKNSLTIFSWTGRIWSITFCTTIFWQLWQAIWIMIYPCTNKNKAGIKHQSGNNWNKWFFNFKNIKKKKTVVCLYFYNKIKFIKFVINFIVSLHHYKCTWSKMFYSRGKKYYAFNDSSFYPDKQFHLDL